jgi:hypothetical protein
MNYPRIQKIVPHAVNTIDRGIVMKFRRFNTMSSTCLAGNERTRQWLFRSKTGRHFSMRIGRDASAPDVEKSVFTELSEHEARLMFERGGLHSDVLTSEAFPQTKETKEGAK